MISKSLFPAPNIYGDIFKSFAFQVLLTYSKAEFRAEVVLNIQCDSLNAEILE